MLKGQCYCGMITYEMPQDVVHNSMCNCSDCRRHSGAPVVAWAMAPIAQVSISGEPKIFNSSEHGRRSFCEECGTGLFFTNASLEKMGMMQVRVATLDCPEAQPPQIQVQTAERIGWMATAHELPMFDRFPV